MSYQKQIEKYKAILDQQHHWPCEYVFKFIVPKEKREEVLALFPDLTAQERESNEGNYISFTFNYQAPSSDMVLAIYEKAALIEGLIAL